MNEILKYADVETPSASFEWQRLTDEERLCKVSDALIDGSADFKGSVNVIRAKKNGEIIVELREALPAGKRGTLLLDLEAFLKENIDPGLVVWLNPLGDRNSLRNLRGVEVKS